MTTHSKRIYPATKRTNRNVTGGFQDETVIAGDGLLPMMRFK
jgi:hypothetical protein